MYLSPDSQAWSGRDALARNPKEAAMHWMDGWDWVWMTFMMVFWVVALAAAVYVAVKLANRPPTDRRQL
jgi:heme/copper-type cytochrome/quinol oxidase subunit 2